MPSKAKSPVFDPRDLRDVRSLCAEGLIPYHYKTAERFCRDGEMPAIKVGTFEDDGSRRAHVSMEAREPSL